MKENIRKCIKCGASGADDPDITLHRFPIPRAWNAERCEQWAKFAFPHRNWRSREFHEALYKHHRMLCNKHFSWRSFINKKLVKNAIPQEDVEALTNFPGALPSPISLDPNLLPHHTKWDKSTGTNEHNVGNKHDNGSIRIISDEIIVRQPTSLAGDKTVLTCKPPTKPQASTEPEQDNTTPGQVNKEPSSMDHGNTVPEIVNKVPTCNDQGITIPEKVNAESVADPLEVNQGYEDEVQETAAVAYSTDNDDDDDYQPSASGVSTDDEDASEEATRRVTRQVTSSQPEVEETSCGPCWCCLKQGAHSVADIPALLDCFNVPIEVPPDLVARVCSECENFLSRARHFRDMVVCSQQVLSNRGPVVQLDNSIEEDENATLRLEYVSETGKVQDMKVPLKDLYFDSSGHLVQYALQDNEESDDQESENDPPKEMEEAEASRVECNKRPNPLQKAGPTIKRQRTTQNMNITHANNQSKAHIDVRQSPGLTHNKNVRNVALRNSRNLYQSNVQPIEVNPKALTQKISKSVTQVIPSKDVGQTMGLRIEQVDGKFVATTSNVNQSNVQGVKKTALTQKVPKSHNVTQAKVPPKGVGQTIELLIEQIDGQFVVTTSNVNQPNVQPIGVQKTLKTHKIANLVQLPPINQDQTIESSIEQVVATTTNVNQSNVQPILHRNPDQNISVVKTHKVLNQANVQPTIELKIVQIDEQFVATTSNISRNVALNKTEVHSPSERKHVPVLSKPVKRITYPNILRRNLSSDTSIEKES